MRNTIKKSVPLREQVYNQLLRALRMGEFMPGERVTEEKVATLLDVSRTPVREALALFGERKILNERPGGGYYVPAPSVKEIEEVFETRGLLEPYAVALAAQRRTDADIEALADIVKQELLAVNNEDPTDSFELNLKFRRSLMDIAGNARLARSIAQFEDHMQFIGMLTMQDKSVRKIIADSHHNIVAAVEDGNQKNAEKMMREYLNEASTALMDKLRKYQS